MGTPGGLDVSDDGGATWRHVSDSAFYAARFSPDGETLWLCGNGGSAAIPPPPSVGDRIQSGLRATRRVSSARPWW